MPFKELIAERRDELTTSDRRLIDVLLVDKTEGSFLPAHEIAERAGVHASTAGRLARKLGFKSRARVATWAVAQGLRPPDAG